MTAGKTTEIDARALVEPIDDVPRLALISAFGPEWQIVRERLSDRRDYTLLHKEFSVGRLAGRPVLLFLSGVSMVNAAMSTQLALDHFNIEGIIFSGVAGGADPKMGIGDIVIPEKWGQYLEMVYARETDDGYRLPPFLSSAFANYGMMYTLNIGTFEELAGDGTSRFWFPVDAEYYAAAERAASRFSIVPQDKTGRRLKRTPKVHAGAAGLSGSAFVDNAKFREWAYTTFDACVLDMETAAVSQVADENAVPFIAFRALSDLAGGEVGANEFDIFMTIVGDNLAALVEVFLQELNR